MYGPFKATDNDATIIEKVFANDQELKKLLKENDLFISDRGFRDCVEFLENMNLIVKMPAFLEKSQKQLTTSQANESRFVTKVRWVIEMGK